MTKDLKKPLKLCVLATATPQGKPECAVLAYAVNSDLSLILSTHTTSRKWRNIKANKQVAITLGQSFSELYIQYEGTAELITEGEEFKRCEEIFFTANPQAKQFQNSETAFIKVTSTNETHNDVRSRKRNGTAQIIYENYRSESIFCASQKSMGERDK